MQDLEAIKKFADLLYGQLDPNRDGVVAYMAKHQTTNRVQTYYAPPRTLPDPLRLQRDGWHFWQSVCTFSKRKRKEEVALVVPALWTDLDPPDNLKDGDLEVWQRETHKRLSTFSLLSSIVVFSGRGWHGYWLLEPPLRLEGPDRARSVALVKAINRKLAECLEGDAVADLARVMRIPGTINPKNGATCRMIFSGGPIYNLADLTDALEVKESIYEATQVRPQNAKDLIASEARKPTTRGRPRLGVTVRDLRTLPLWARHLVMGGAWRSGKRYRKPGNKVIDRSRADMAAIGEMVKAGWSDERILAAFKHPRWLIGDRFGELWANQGWNRAVDYLGRTIEKAKMSNQGIG